MNRREFAAGIAACGLARAGWAASPEVPRPAPRPAATWEAWRGRFVRGDGRVVDSANGGVTHTEGLGTALLLAQDAGDRAAFEAVLDFTQKLKRPDGLLSWCWQDGRGTVDRNNASDGDLLIAWALLLGGQRWRAVAWVDQGLELAAALRRHCVVRFRNRLVLLPGAEGFVSRQASGEPRVAVNPSYWVYPALRLLARLDSPTWAAVATSGARLTEEGLLGPRRLPADWLELTDPVRPWTEKPARFGYEAVRVPLYLVWAHQDRHPAVASCARWLTQPRAPAWVALDETERAGWEGPAGFLSTAALLRTALQGAPFEPQPLDEDYYSSSLTMLATLAARSRGWHA